MRWGATARPLTWCGGKGMLRVQSSGWELLLRVMEKEPAPLPAAHGGVLYERDPHGHPGALLHELQLRDQRGGVGGLALLVQSPCAS